MEEKNKLRCPLGVPGGVLAAIIGLIGVIVNVVNFNLMGLLTSASLLLIAMPFVRFVFMVHSANDRLDELERKINKK